VGLLAAGQPAVHSEVVSRKTWNELDPSTRRLIKIAATFEAALKIAALIDLARRPPSEVRGPKVRWAWAILVTNSMGALPIIYFVYGRRRSHPR
jgi:Family of unknown function (DUF5652)